MTDKEKQLLELLIKAHEELIEELYGVKKQCDAQIQYCDLKIRLTKQLIIDTRNKFKESGEQQ